MKILTEDFKYKHIVKLPWLVSIIWTIIFGSIITTLLHIQYNLDILIRLFIFGLAWYLIFGFFDYYASEYRRKILFKNPDLKHFYICNKIKEWEKGVENENKGES